jgi:adenylate cyclase, class 2
LRDSYSTREEPVTPSPCRNLELKARCADLDAARATVLRLGAQPAGIQVQTDTYFFVPTGRLKLRQIEDHLSELIWYDRPNQSVIRTSRYHRVPVAEPDALRAALTAALGVRGEVHKRREVLLWYNIRIHLDDVSGLGAFLEFEAVLASEGKESASRERLDQLCHDLAIGPSDRLAGSYADLLGL